MHDVLRFWLDRGVDGFRMDVVHCIGKDPALPDDPPELAALTHVPLNDRPETHELLRGIARRAGPRTPATGCRSARSTCSTPRRVVAVLRRRRRAAPRRSTSRPLFTPWDAAKWRRQIEIVERRARPGRRLADLGAVEPRQPCATAPATAPRPGPGPRRCCCSPCGARRSSTPARSSGSRTPIVPADRVVDPGGRDGCRAPIPWDAEPGHGWPVAEPWLPWPPDAERLNVASEQADPDSMLHLYRRLLAARRASPGAARRRPDAARRRCPTACSATSGADADDRRVVLINFTDAAGRPSPGTVAGTRRGVHRRRRRGLAVHRRRSAPTRRVDPPPLTRPAGSTAPASSARVR